MSEAEKAQSQWTIETLKEFLESRIEDNQKLSETKLEERDKAVKTAHEALGRRLDALNELRKDVERDRAQFVKTDVYTSGHADLVEKVAENREKTIQMSADIQTNSTEIAAMKNSLMWLTRLIAGALIMGILGYIFQRLTGR